MININYVCVDAEEYNEFPAYVAAYQDTDTDGDYDSWALVGPHKKVIEDETIQIRFDYPLNNPVMMEFTNEGGFTRLGLFRCIYEGYEKIYREEEETSSIAGGFMPGSLNRNRTDGTYGVWGHVITDLVIEGVIPQGEGVYHLAIGS